MEDQAVNGYQSTCEILFSNHSLKTTRKVMFVCIRAEGPTDFSPGRAGAAGDALGQRRPKRPFRLKDGESVGVQRSRRPSGEKRGRRAAEPRAAIAARSCPGLKSRRPSGEKHGRWQTESRAPLAAASIPPEADRRILKGTRAENAHFRHGHVPAIRPKTSASGSFHPSGMPDTPVLAGSFRKDEACHSMQILAATDGVA